MDELRKVLLFIIQKEVEIRTESSDDTHLPPEIPISKTHEPSHLDTSPHKPPPFQPLSKTPPSQPLSQIPDKCMGKVKRTGAQCGNRPRVNEMYCNVHMSSTR